MKTRKLVVTGFVVTILILAIFINANEGGKIESAASAKDLFRNLPTPTLYPTSLPGISVRALQKYALSEILTVSAGGIEMSAANFRLENNEFKVDLCFQSPNKYDWIHDAFIQIGDEKITPYGGTTFERTETLGNGQKRITTYLGDPPQLEWNIVSSDGLPDYRCDTLAFRLDATPITARVTLQVIKIMTTPNEGEGCAEYRDMVQSILNDRSAGIKVDCSQNNFEFGARTRFLIIEKPSTMSQDEAEQIISDILQEFFTINGPWIFVGTIEP